MFTGTVDVGRLYPLDAREDTVRQINKLLRLQHSEASEITSLKQLREHMASLRVFIARMDDNIVGMAVILPSNPLGHTCTEIRNLVVMKGLDTLAIRKRLLESIRDSLQGNAYRYVEMKVNEYDDELRDIALVLGFKLRPKIVFRLKIKQERLPRKKK